MPNLLLLAFIVTLLALPTFELPRPVPLIIAIILTACAWIIAVFGGHIDLT